MATRLVHKYAFNTSTLIGLGSGSAQVNLDALDLSRFDELELEVVVNPPAVDADDTLTIYLQSRGRSGVWDDRIATATFTGDQPGTEVRKYAVQQFGTFADAEEASEPTGSAGGSRLTAGTVKNGSFPPPYRTKGAGGGTSTAWRLDFVQVDGAGTDDATFTGTVYVYGNSADQGSVNGH